MITQSELKEKLHYDPDTGDFTWLKTGSGKNSNGKAGGINNTTKYVMIGVSGRKYVAHHLAWLYITGRWPEQIDHVNHGRSDNRWVNLRESTQQENCKNRSLSSINKSGLFGVSWHKPTSKWMSLITVDRKSVFLGRFDDFFEACCARLSANNKHGFHPNHGGRNLYPKELKHSKMITIKGNKDLEVGKLIKRTI